MAPGSSRQGKEAVGTSLRWLRVENPGIRLNEALQEVKRRKNAFNCGCFERIPMVTM